MPFPQTIVYVLKSDADPTRYYTGLTSNLAARLEAHNAGRVPHTAGSENGRSVNRRGRYGLSSEAWHRRFNIEAAISGHLHLRSTRTIDDVRFEEVSLGYPRQWDQRRGLVHYLRRIL